MVLPVFTYYTMHRPIYDHNSYNLIMLTIDYNTNFTTMLWQTIEHMAVFVVRSIRMQIIGQVMDLSIGPTIVIGNFNPDIMKNSYALAVSFTTIIVFLLN